MPGLVTPSWSLRSTGSAIRRRVTRTIADLGERRITLRALREGIDTATPAGRAVAAIMATLAELELELGRERLRRVPRIPPIPTPAGYEAAKAQPRSAQAVTATRCHWGSQSVSLPQAFGVGRATAYRYLAVSAEGSDGSATSEFLPR